jgi:hypothetical protein
MKMTRYAWHRSDWSRFTWRSDEILNLLGRFAIILATLFFLTYPTASFAFYALGDINQYLSYDRLKVITPIDEKYNFHPRVQGRLINKTNKQVYVSVHLYFCDIFNQRHNQASLNISMRPEEKVEFDKYLKGSEWERTRTAHHVEFEIVKLIVGSRNITK